MASAVLLERRRRKNALQVPVIMEPIKRKTQNFMGLKWPKIKTFIVKNTKDYCNETTIHGLKYIANSSLYPLERIFFACSFVIVVIGAVFFVDKVYEKWNYTPVIVSINSKPTGITQDPFPAVTICNLNLAYKQKVEELSIYSTEYAMIQLMCRLPTNDTIAKGIADWSNLRDFISGISQPCSEMLISCKYGGVKYKCTEIFQPVVTDTGYCCVFNMVHEKFLVKRPSECANCKDHIPKGTEYVDWNPEAGYQKNLPRSYIPGPAVGTGESLGLSVTLDVEADYYYCSSASSVGFKILLHNPLEVPNMREIGLLLTPGRETKVRITAVKTDSEQSLRSTSILSRKCLFADEKPLDYYRFYTQRNCEMECLTKMLLNYCGCVTHFVPLYFGKQTICSIYEQSCVKRVHLQSMVTNNGRGCVEICLPGCYDLTYLPDFFTTPLSHLGSQVMNQDIKNMSGAYVEKNIAVVNIYFKEVAYRSNKQSEYIGITDFLSSIGGIIGLFFGFSFISLAEFIFYFLLKPIRVLIVKFWSKGHIKRRMFKKFQPFEKLSKPSKNLNSTKQIKAIDNYFKGKINTDTFHSKGDYPEQKFNIPWQPGMEYTP